MADVRISNLAAAVAANLDGNSLVPTTDSELTITTVKVTMAQMRTGLLTRANGNYAATDYISLGGASPPSTGWIRVDGTTVTSSTPILNAIQTWNQGATVFTGFLMQITNTTSSASSLLVDLQVGGFSKWKVDVSGNITSAGNLNTQAITATSGLYTAGLSCTTLAGTGAVSGFTTAAFSDKLSVQVSGMTSAVKIGQVSDATTYGVLTFNNTFSGAGLMGVFGGGSGDDSMYVQGGATSGVRLRVAGTSRVIVLDATCTISSTTTAVQALTTAGLLQTGTDILRSQNSGAAAPTGSTGVGFETLVSAGVTIVQSFNRTSVAVAPLQFNCSTLGFYGVSGIARAVLATGTGKTVDNVITALQNLGLVSQT